MDLAILKFINLTISSPVLDFIFKNIGEFKLWAFPIVIILAILFWRGGRKARWMIGMSILTVIVVDSSLHLIFKPIFHRLRPCHAEPAITWLRTIAGCGGKYGFPSSHAANTFSQAFVIGAFYKPARKYLYLFAILVSISRVYLGVHYPLDILGGAVYGVLFGGIVLYLLKRYAPEQAALYLVSRPEDNLSITEPQSNPAK